MSTERLTAKRKAEILNSVKERYRAVASDPTGHFCYPVGRESAVGLGYEPEWLNAVPAEVVDRFVGVGNPFSVRRPVKGQSVLDVGCGSGLDAFVAAALVGADGRSVGVDMAPEMLEWPKRAVAAGTLGNIEFREGSVEELPFEDESFDLVISNGVLNLVPDKDAAFQEMHRVLRPGGSFAAADLLVVASIPADVLTDVDAWST